MEINKIHNQDCLIGLKTLPDNSIDCCVTSPPYYGLRDYGHAEQIGLEETPELYVSKMVEVFREVKRVLKKECTLWLNIGDSYAGSGKGGQSEEKRSKNWQPIYPKNETKNDSVNSLHNGQPLLSSRQHHFFDTAKPKDLIGIPWMLAFALRADGWYLRQDIIWAKPNPMPESVTDRCTKSHEYIFLLSKSSKYYYDAEAIKETASYNTHERVGRAALEHKYNPTEKVNGIRPRKLAPAGNGMIKNNESFDAAMFKMPDIRNKRSVWTVTTKPYSDAHFATFPEDLILDMIKAGCPDNGIVLDPFMGAGTTALVASKLNRNYVGFELNEQYIKIAQKRLRDHLGMFNKAV